MTLYGVGTSFNIFFVDASLLLVLVVLFVRVVVLCYWFRYWYWFRSSVIVQGNGLSHHGRSVKLPSRFSHREIVVLANMIQCSELPFVGRK